MGIRTLQNLKETQTVVNFFFWDVFKRSVCGVRFVEFCGDVSPVELAWLCSDLEEALRRQSGKSIEATSRKPGGWKSGVEDRFRRRGRVDRAIGGRGERGSAGQLRRRHLGCGRGGCGEAIPCRDPESQAGGFSQGFHSEVIKIFEIFRECGIVGRMVTENKSYRVDR
jgi:hypothetical protein